MSFLQPWLLAALPLAGLPILIHLINQRRYSTVEWGAMQFLLSANQMSRGFARVRRWLILLMRTLAIAGLIFAISRPLASGWLGLTGSTRADTTIVVLDRSPSMQYGPSGLSKLDAARQQLVETLETLGSERWVLIDSATAKPQDLVSPASLLDSPNSSGVSAAADLPGLMQAVHDYIKANKPGRTEVWIASDLRENDWQAEDGRWPSLKNAMLEFPQEVNFHLLTYAEPTPNTGRDNLSIRVIEARRETVGSRVELLVSLVVSRQVGAEADGSTELVSRNVPLRFEIDGVASTFDIELAGTRFELNEYRIPLSDDATQGWGKVSLPADTNLADNEAFLVFDEPPVRRTAVVASDGDRVRALKLAASISPRVSLTSEANITTPNALSTLAWEEIALVVWQAPLPEDKQAKRLQAFLDRGGRVLFLPPRAPTTASFSGIQWQAWQEPTDPLAPDSWRGDQDLLAKVGSGASLPVGRWKVKRHCSLTGEFNTLASLPGGVPLIARAITDHGGAYFCTTTTDQRDSTLAADGIVLYVAIQRLINDGMASLGNTRTQPAGQSLPRAGSDWQTVADKAPGQAIEALSTDYQFHSGIYRNDEKLVAVNRPALEDVTATLTAERVDRLFEGLDFDRLEGQATPNSSLVREIWRLFLGAMMLALTVEAGLCLPRVVATNQSVPFAEAPKSRRIKPAEAVA